MSIEDWIPYFIVFVGLLMSLFKKKKNEVQQQPPQASIDRSEEDEWEDFIAKNAAKKKVKLANKKVKTTHKQTHAQPPLHTTKIPHLEKKSKNIKKLLKNLPSNQVMFICHEIFGKPKGLEK